MPSQFNVLISSAGRRVALLRILRETLSVLGLSGRVLAADRSPLAPAYHLADEAFVVPPVADADFIPAMLDLCARRDVKLVVPTIDPELGPYAAGRHLFAELGATVAVSSSEVTEIGADKRRTNAWLAANRFPTVRQASVAEVLADPGSWDFPVVVKPCSGSSAVGVRRIDNPAALELSAADGGLVVEARARGTEYTVDFLADRLGRCVCSVPRRRIEVRAGEVSKAETVRRPDVIELADRICDQLPHPYGALNLQVFADGPELQVIEINPRFGGGFPLTWRAGAHFPRWMIEEILGRPTSASISGWADGVVMLRFDEAVFLPAPGPEPPARAEDTGAASDLE